MAEFASTCRYTHHPDRSRPCLGYLPLLLRADCLGVALVIIWLSTLSPSVQAEYVVPSDFDQLPTVTISPVGNSTDATNFTNAMNGLSAQGGGVIFMDPGSVNYKMSGIELASNIHVRMRPGVTIEQNTATNIFSIDNGATNVSLEGTSAASKPVLKPFIPAGVHRTAHSFRAVRVNDATNFKISNLKIEENDTRFSTIVTTAAALQGTIEDIVMTGSGPGWGLYQVQGGTDIHTRNLDGQGGYTLRLEQGGNTSVIDNVVAENIINRNGRAAVLILPKGPDNGTVQITKVRSFGSKWAVEAGDGKEDGRFEQVTITDVEATYEASGAQFKRFGGGGLWEDFLPESEKDDIVFYDFPDKPTKFKLGPSFGVVRSSTAEWTTINDIKDPIGFPDAFEDQPAVIRGNMRTLIESQRLANPAIPVLPGDYDGDGGVDGSDFLAWQRNINAEAGSLVNDFLNEDVGSAQLDIWRTKYGSSVLPAASLSSIAVPEPSSLSLLATGLLLFRRPCAR